MKILNSQKFLSVGMTPADYRTGMIHLMMMLEKHSEEFKTPEQLVALIHEYSELLTTIYSLDNDNNDDTYDDEDISDIDDEEGGDEEDVNE